MEIGVAAKKYLIEIEVRKYTPKTIRSYRNNLNLFLRFCEEEAKIFRDRRCVPCSCSAFFSLSERQREKGKLYQWPVESSKGVYPILL